MKCSSTKNEISEVDIVDCGNKEMFAGNENRLKNDSLPSTTKQNFEPSCWKNEVGRRHQTYSGPLLPSSVRGNSLSERSRIPERFGVVSFFNVFISCHRFILNNIWWCI